MFFGSYGGLTFFNPAQIVDSPSSPPVRLTDIQILGKPVSIGGNSPLKRSISDNRVDDLELTLKSVVSLEFSALSLRIRSGIGTGTGWKGGRKWYETDSSRRFVTYTTLARATTCFACKAVIIWASGTKMG